MLPPEGYIKAKLGQVSKIQRSLYGLKQASIVEFGTYKISHI